MIELKLRAWDKKNKKMRFISGLTLDIIENCVESVQFEGMEGKAILNWRVDQFSEVMQFIGLKDKNGTEIFEEDILRIDKRLYLVKRRNDACFGIVRLNFLKENINELPNWTLLQEVDKEVVGNFYENKELLGGNYGNN